MNVYDLNKSERASTTLSTANQLNALQNSQCLENKKTNCNETKTKINFRIFYTFNLLTAYKCLLHNESFFMAKILLQRS